MQSSLNKRNAVASNRGEFLRKFHILGHTPGAPRSSPLPPLLLPVEFQVSGYQWRLGCLLLLVVSVASNRVTVTVIPVSILRHLAAQP